MASVVYLKLGEEMPDVCDDSPWILIHQSGDGRSGASWKTSGEWVGYRSLSEDDVSLESALVAAQKWAATYEVSTIWIEGS